MINSVELKYQALAQCVAMMCVTDAKFLNLKSTFIKMAQGSDVKD